jgi:hypothetical protein
MRRLTDWSSRLAAFLTVTHFFSVAFSAPGLPGTSLQITGRIVSKHVAIWIPSEREWLGRETIVDLERCYIFMDKSTGGSLPARLLVRVSWDEQESGSNLAEAVIKVGMDDPAAANDSRSYLLHNAAREMARLALLGLSKGGADRAENRFILEGMTEIMAAEFERSSRGLNTAWVRCHFMDRIAPLSLAALASWDRFSDGMRGETLSSPGITFLLSCRKTGNRDSLVKLFEEMRRKSLPECLAAAFKSTAAALETAWLDRIRTYQVAGDITVTSDEDAPKLERTQLDPDAGVPGEELRIRAFIRDRSDDLPAEAIYLEEHESGRVFRAQAPPEANGKYVQFNLFLGQDAKPGRYDYRLVAADEKGNVRIWPGVYRVASE